MLGLPEKTRYDLRWAFFEIAFRVHPLFWFGAVALGWYEEIPLSLLLLWVGCVLFSILIHELGHAVCARVSGCREIEIALHLLGGLTSHEAVLETGRKIWVTLCGPLASFSLAGVAFLILRAGEPWGGDGSYLAFALSILCRINLVWGLFNLLPIYPLDGGQVQHELLVDRRPFDGHELSHKISMAVALGLLILLAITPFFFRKHLDQNQVLLGPCYFTIILLISFVIQNYYMLRMVREDFFGAGGWAGSFDAPRQPWERDPDWWKKK